MAQGFVKSVVTVKVDHLTEFALGDGSQDLFLPALQGERAPASV